MNDFVETGMLGTGATAVVDLWAIVRRALFGTPLPDYSLVGRWIGHMAHLRFRHASIADAAPVRGERPIGWIFHYGTGIAFAAMLVAGTSGAWLQRPTASAAMLVGIGTVAAPFLLLQPATGAGFAASRTARPGRARLQSLVTHAMFGAGLFFTGALLHAWRT
jgi:hypothetical protein